MTIFHRAKPEGFPPVRSVTDGKRGSIGSRPSKQFAEATDEYATARRPELGEGETRL